MTILLFPHRPVLRVVWVALAIKFHDIFFLSREVGRKWFASTKDRHRSLFALQSRASTDRATMLASGRLDSPELHMTPHLTQLMPVSACIYATHSEIPPGD